VRHTGNTGTGCAFQRREIQDCAVLIIYEEI